MPYLIFALLGYLSGSIMYSQLLPSVFYKTNIMQVSDDNNPGAGNVFKHLGIAPGLLCLLCDILKGTIPVALCLHYLHWCHPLFALVMAAPVFGHAKKGKAIAVSFGVLIGLIPFHFMVFYLVFPFLGFSIFVRINPHAWRVILSFLCFIVAIWFRVPTFSLRLGSLLLTITVIARHAIFIKNEHMKFHLDYGWDFSKLKRNH